MLIDQKLNNAIKTFEQFGFKVIKKAEHIKMKRDDGTTISVPNHKVVKGSTICGICTSINILHKDYVNMSRKV